jgi:hypothetical protein
MEHVVIFNEHLENYTVFWYNLWSFGIVCSHFVYFSRFGMFGPRKIWQHWTEALTRKLKARSEEHRNMAMAA